MSNLGIRMLGYACTAGLAFLFFSFAVAQETGAAAPIYCPNLSITMQKCDPNRPLSQQHCTDATTGGQVTELQRFLSDYYDLNPDDYVTGYFGRLTRDNVRKFQCEKGIECTGDEATTGYGVVGPRTRARIAQVCGTQTPPLQCIPEQPQTQTLSCPTGQTGSITQTRYSSCPGPTWGSWITTAATCQAAANNSSFSVAPLSGIAPLNVTATFQNGSSCTPFTLTWGDGTNDNYNGPPAGTSCTQQTVTITKTHTYSQTGTSTVTFQMSGGAAYTQTVTVTAPQTTQPPTVTLTANGQQSVTLAPGAIFTIAWSSSNATSCNLTNAQGQTNPTPPNVSGSSQGAAGAAGTTYTYTLACTNSGGTTTKTASVTSQTTAASSVGACTFRGETFPEDTVKTIKVVQGGTGAQVDLVMTCDNGAWVSQDTRNYGAQICSATLPPNTILTAADFGCSGNPIGYVNPRHGRVPLSVTIGKIETGVSPTSPCKIYDLAWGDGTTVVVQPGPPLQDSCGSYYSSSYTYKAPGSFVISLQARDPWGPNSPYPKPPINTANIRVDGATTLAPQSSQLANALTALESALKAILQLLQ